MPRFSRSVLVTNRSSPTSCTLSPSFAVSFFQPAQSSSARPSSMERIGHLSHSFVHRSIISSDEMTLVRVALEEAVAVLALLCFASSNSSVVAGSRAKATWSPSL